MSDIKWDDYPQWYSDVIKEAHRQQCPESFLIQERLLVLQNRIRELDAALSELAYWARDIAGDCDDPIKSQQEDEMMKRINKILEKDDE